MIGYKMITSSRGDRYIKDGRLIKKADVPEHILDQLKAGENLEQPKTEVVDTLEERRQQDRNCLFCSAYTTWKRHVNSQEVPICETHFFEMNVGQIAQKLAEVR
jgi:hypothetical protein